MVKSGLEFFYFEIHQASSELLLPSTKKSAQKGRLAGIFEGAQRNSKIKILDHFTPSFLGQKC